MLMELVAQDIMDQQRDIHLVKKNSIMKKKIKLIGEPDEVI